MRELIIGFLGGILGGGAWKAWEWWKQKQYEARLAAEREAKPKRRNAREKKKKADETPLPM